MARGVGSFSSQDRVVAIGLILLDLFGGVGRTGEILVATDFAVSIWRSRVRSWTPAPFRDLIVAVRGFLPAVEDLSEGPAADNFLPGLT